MIQNYIENANFEDTGFHYALSLISGKHKMVILYCLMEYCIMRAAAATDAQSERPPCPVGAATLRSRCATYLK